MSDVLTISETVARAKAENMAVTAYSLRAWVKSGQIPSRKIGNKHLIYWPNVAAFLSCSDMEAAPPAPDVPKIRPLY